jgi:hypothetical protein
MKGLYGFVFRKSQSLPVMQVANTDLVDNFCTGIFPGIAQCLLNTGFWLYVIFEVSGHEAIVRVSFLNEATRYDTTSSSHIQD